ncbi:MotA/TolQ/ExbB proton channel family protein [Lacipirellula sp.]|uniref:MotA/TolQ/ExbB proton channel family protein n=1 Tax=Lacipirellula sp. TaxID=2691419 RepID=UPI003D13B749
MSRSRKNPVLAALDASFLIGAVCSAIFYAIMLSPAMKDSTLHRYTTEHLVEYVVVILTFWGLADVLRKLASFPREILALRQKWVPERKRRVPAMVATSLLEDVEAKPKWLRESRIGRRYVDAFSYVIENGADSNFRDHLQLLAHHDSERMNGSYTLIRFVVRITPVLGFLGTVVHFGTALNGITLDKMSDQLGVVVSEMGQAFNATTVALAAAMCMMFCQFVCEWIEKAILQSVDRNVEEELFNRFELKDASISPFLSVIKEANEDANKLMAANLETQTATWIEAFEMILQRLDARQKQEGQAWTQALETLHSRHESYDAVREERLRQILDAIGESQDRFMGQIHATIDKAALLRNDFSEVVRTIHGIAQGEGRLLELQATLSDNLRLIHETRQFEDAVHGLTGAIHLLTARHGGDGRKSAA